MPALRRVLALCAGLVSLLGVPAVAHARGVPAPAAHGVSPARGARGGPGARGGVTLPAGARALGAAPASALLHATVALRPRDPRALAVEAAAVSTPGSPDYRHYLTVAAFARRFAPTAAQRRLVRARLRARGLVVGATSADGLSIAVRGSVRVSEEAFSTAIDRIALPDGPTAQAMTAPARLGGAAGRVVQAVIGLDTVAPTASVILRRGRVRSTAGVAARAARRAAGARPCAAAAASEGGLTTDQIAARYGLSNLHAAGDEGRGVTVALYELEPFSSSDIAGYEACLGTGATVETEPVDGGAGSGPGSGEAAADVEDLIGLAPGATIRVYEGPPTAEGAYATYSAIVSDDAAQVVSTSWGLCEAEVGPLVAEAENVLFQEAALQGQSVLAAAGDSGADDCANGTRAVDDPASQPWVTGVGGTSIHGSADTVWDDALGAGGGGVSELWGRPWWQTAAVAQSAVTCGAGPTACREVPDISADADPVTGEAAYYRGAWQTVGGTSVAAPTVAALAALADASPACAGRPLGFLDPALYAHAADIADVTSGDNGFAGVPGFPAGPGYDLASGLGTPTATLGPALCGDSLSLATPAAQSWSTARAVALAPHATSAKAAAITWSASGLPAGVAIDATSGRIAGTPTAAGRHTVILTALDADGATATVSFTATVTRAPGNASRGRASRRSRGRRGAARLHVQRLGTISARVGRVVRVRLRVQGARGAAVRYRAHGLPAGLRIGRRTGVLSGTPIVAGRASVTIRVSVGSDVVVTARVAVRIDGRARRVHALVRERRRARGSRRSRR